MRPMPISRQTRQQLDLLRLLVQKEITLKYKRTYMGFLWSLLNPLLTSLVLFVAFSIFMRFQIDNFVLFLLSGLFPWTWFASAVTMSPHTLTSNVSLIKKVLFPKHFLVFATVTVHLVNFLYSLPVLLGLTYFYGGAPSVNWLIGVPLLAVIQFATVFGLSLVIAMVNAYFRDLEHLVGVLVSLLFWMTPIVYPLETVPERIRPVLALNPVTYLMQAWRDLFFHNRLHWHHIAIAAATAAAVLIVGLLIFKRLDAKLDEVL